MKNDIKTIEDLLLYKVTKEMWQENIQARQKELYRQNSVKKRACNTGEDIRQYQIWHMDVQSELDSLKQEKREIRQYLKLVDECLKEKLYTVGIDIADMEVRISNTVEMPEYSYGKNERVWDDSGKGAAVDRACISDMVEIEESSRDTESPNVSQNYVVAKVKYADKHEEVVQNVSTGKMYEENLYDKEVRSDSTDIYGDIGKEGNSVLSVTKSDINEVVEAMREDIYGELVSDAVMTEPVADVTETMSVS